QILDIGAVGPGVAGCLIGQPRARQAFAQIGDGLVGDLRGEGLRLRVHSASSIAGLIGNLFSGDGWVQHRESPFRCWLVWATPAKDICWYRVMSTSKTCMVVFMRLSEKYAVPEELALLYDFVNTLDRRRYVERGVVHAGGDELATPRRMEAWMRKPHLPASGKHVASPGARSAQRLALVPGTSARGTGEHRRGAPADRGQQGFSADSDRCRRGNRHAGCGPWIECA